MAVRLHLDDYGHDMLFKEGPVTGFWEETPF
jgi:hypothetical protein